MQVHQRLEQKAQSAQPPLPQDLNPLSTFGYSPTNKQTNKPPSRQHAQVGIAPPELRAQATTQRVPKGIPGQRKETAEQAHRVSN